MIVMLHHTKVFLKKAMPCLLTSNMIRSITKHYDCRCLRYISSEPEKLKYLPCFSECIRANKIKAYGYQRT